ncbi:3-phenylpropionate/cinnamic acid dioxygenase small subunit [Litorivivens lipolytica]|uniref:3-phenylpropionate/cinnamic acid dioxygenase small subunit n=1 Tax=Litorivivens lipolytica TaxID=1524264 RepID=A0A7W4W5D3_9GAMM|nr:aromatic-ring-hydroxylating dioxygenase subunit beta [Litorivivens lipolytica]MBB3047204.1 3-phenylpropionate/cinnamic acid dioxygenase small subunit [Litorivivens lipolytica]
MSALERQYQVEQFYYREARLLDNREYQSWLALIHPEIRYSMPGRSNPMVNNRERGQQDMISVERELEGLDSNGLPIRDENYAILWLRVDRAYKMNSWAENPPARTRRIIGNIEILDDDGDTLQVVSNFHLFYARPGLRDFFYAGQRRDTLIRQDSSFQIRCREIVMDMADINVPTLGLLL